MKGYCRRSGLILVALVIAGLFYRFIPDRRDEAIEILLKDARSDPVFLLSPAPWVDSVLNSLTPEQRVAQMIMVAAYSNNNDANEKEVEMLVRDYGVGGLVFFQGSPGRQVSLTNYYQSIAKTRLLIAMDAEWGLGMRLDSTIRYPRQMMLGAIQDDRLIFDMGSQIADQMKRIGVHINFAPVIDINNNPENPVINSRSFGEDRSNVTRKALFYMIGMENKGLMSVAKHFPGHGDTNADSHEELPEIKHPRERLDSLELFPFRELIYHGLSGIMTAHLQIPTLDSRKKSPASLSERVIDSLLRHEMGFEGLIFTDAMNMKGITNDYKPVEAAEKALRAGNDVLVMPGDVPGVIEHIVRLVKRGKISQEEIDTHCRRILAAKYYAGLNHFQPVESINLQRDLCRPEYRLLQRQLIGSAITVLRNRNNLIPLRHLDTLKVASVVFSANYDSLFQQTLGLYMPVDNFYLSGDGFDDTDSIFNELKKYNLVIASVHSSDIRSSLQYGISDCLIDLVDSLATRQEVLLDLFANPYILNRFRQLDKFRAVVVSYENSTLTQEISAQLTFGALGASGTMPVTAGLWKSMTSGQPATGIGRLRFNLPLAAGMNEDSLLMIDGIISDAIEKQAIPGCQVLVARKGIVVLNKAFGNHFYGNSKPVSVTDLYDLASVTKVVGTTAALMRLVDEDCLDINQKLSTYLPYLEKTNKKDLVIKDVLLHQSGLIPFIQFYFSMMQPVFRDQILVSPKMSETNPIRVSTTQFLNRYTDFKNNFISSSPSSHFPLKVADNMYIIRSVQDTIYHGIASSPLLEKKEFVYSDLGFILFKQLVDSITRVPFDHILDSVFYRKLGAGRLCFNPLNRFNRDEIAPTEYDQIFRKQQIHGYVHDPRAAMLGGISGHAGLFGNAFDLAKVLQMMLNQGEYGGEQFIRPETIELFTSKPLGYPGNRRGLGFDKPEPDKTKPQPSVEVASAGSYGHTGFTGNMIWVDPAYDLIYIFLSNRVYPDAENTKLAALNVRTRIQQVIYNAIMEGSAP
jgi:beta-glucosidase-like glycosyl hydrolase/CubicO group peptidase (beta-lactamase class C family)